LPWTAVESYLKRNLDYFHVRKLLMVFNLYYRLEQKYEEHPLVDAFNVYLQIFLSQALEPGFLSAIREADGRFIYFMIGKLFLSTKFSQVCRYLCFSAGKFYSTEFEIQVFLSLKVLIL
jgi:hypothetical protein